MSTRAFLICGIASSIWYVAINLIVPPFWPDYSSANQTISELSAIGAPTRILWVFIVMPYLLLFAAFALGVLRSAGESRLLRATGWLMVLYAVFNLYWPPMHMRETLASGGGSLTDTLHLVWAGVTVGLFLLIMCCAGFVLGKRFAVFTVVSIAILTVFGVLTSMGAPNVSANLPTPWIGVYERINIAVFLAWIAALAAVLMRRNTPTAAITP